jgi:hypothetical protein
MDKKIRYVSETVVLSAVACFWLLSVMGIVYMFYG